MDLPPAPTYEFYIPSIHDDTALACRIYSAPESYFGGGSPDFESNREKPWAPKGAIVAHPYSSLGGSYDDTTVLHVVSALMKKRFTVGTFNFRGVGKSGGKATWTSKAELQDYISFVGFFMYYLSNVYPPVEGSESFDNHFPLQPILSGVPAIRPPAHLVLAGYSYGALMTRYLPNVPAMLRRFSRVLETSTEAEIRSRAAELATVTQIDILSPPPIAAREVRSRSKGKGKGKGEERARDSGSLDSVPTDWLGEKETLMRVLQTPFKRKETKNSWPDRGMGFSPCEEDFIAHVHVPTPKTHYLLVSLLLEPLAAFCTGFRKFGRLDVDGDSLDEKFLHNATLVVHGKKDRLTSIVKIEKWADWRMVDSEERFQIVGVADSGHFWGDGKAVKTLKAVIGMWVQKHVREESESN
ncbi:MAG: hypothetical protein Q9210_007196 [Variospora velana]